MRREASGAFSYLSEPLEQLSCLHALTVATGTEVTAEAVGSAPSHSKFGGMPGLAGLVLELAQVYTRDLFGLQCWELPNAYHGTDSNT